METFIERLMPWTKNTILSYLPPVQKKHMKMWKKCGSCKVNMASILTLQYLSRPERAKSRCCQEYLCQMCKVKKHIFDNNKNEVFQIFTNWVCKTCDVEITYHEKNCECGGEFIKDETSGYYKCRQCEK